MQNNKQLTQKEKDGYNKRAVGARYEEMACAFLERSGARILARNFRARLGEIDIITKEGEYVVFVEVKYRATASAGTGEDAVGPKKQYTICRVADYYRTQFHLSDGVPIRFDVVVCAVDTDGETKIKRYQNAFPYHPQHRATTAIYR